MNVITCEFRDVYQKLPTHWHEYLIRLIHHKENTCFPDYIEVIIDSHKFYDELLGLQQGKVDRIYFTYWMQDIDIFKSGDDYIINHSPTECVNYYYRLSPEEYQKLIDAVKPKELEATQ